MPRTVTLHRMLVASPGDCAGERKMIPRLVADWNAAHSLATATIIESVLWETHARPELGDRAQGIINRQLVDACDFVVGVFWTRIGTPTGVAPSGTAEEIERFRSAGKEVLLYFSNAPIPPDKIDPEQYGALRDYQKRVEPTGLTFRYTGLHDFERLFSRHLARYMASLITPSESSPGHEELAQILAAVAPAATVDSGTISALETLRTKTRYFWAELLELPAYRNEFVTEMKEHTYDNVKPALDHLASLGHLTYRFEHVYNMITDGSAVLNVTVQNVTTQLKNLAKNIADQPTA
jgi:hypothetical protein